MEVALLKIPNGGLVPLTEEEAGKLSRFRAGTVVRGEFREMRNGGLFRKWWTLARLAFELADERLQPMQHEGRAVLPSFDRFRKDLIVLAGYFDPVFGADGSVKMEPHSLQWSKMSEDEFDRLYSATIDVVLQKVIPGSARTEEDLRRAVDLTMQYA